MNLSINLPEHARILEPKNHLAVKEEMLALKEGLTNSIGSPPLKEIVKATDKVAIAISNIIRPTPNEKLIPAIIEAFQHVPLRISLLLTISVLNEGTMDESFI